MLKSTYGVWKQLELKINRKRKTDLKDIEIINENKETKWINRESKSLLENCGQFFIVAGVYPLRKFQVIFFFLYSLPHLYFLLRTSIITALDEFAIFIEAIHFAGILISCLVCLTSFYVNEKNMDKLNYLKDMGLYNYEDTLDFETLKEIDTIIKTVKERKKFRSKFMQYSIGTAVFMLGILRPLYDLLTGKYANATFHKGIVRKAPIAVWTAYDGSSWFGFINLYIAEYYIIIQCGVIVLGLCSYFICISEDMCMDLLILKISLRRLTRRANYVATKRTGKQKKNIFHHCLRYSIKHHQKIIECFQHFDAIYSWILFTIITGASILICLSGFLFSSPTVEFGLKASNGLFVVLEIVHTFLYCYYGDEIYELSEDVGYEIYRSEWIENSIILKHHQMIIKTRSSVPLKLSAMNFYEVSLNTFGNVLRTAYSYFNIINASME